MMNFRKRPRRFVTLERPLHHLEPRPRLGQLCAVDNSHIWQVDSAHPFLPTTATIRCSWKPQRVRITTKSASGKKTNGSELTMAMAVAYGSKLIDAESRRWALRSRPDGFCQTGQSTGSDCDGASGNDGKWHRPGVAISARQGA